MQCLPSSQGSLALSAGLVVLLQPSHKLALMACQVLYTPPNIAISVQVMCNIVDGRTRAAHIHLFSKCTKCLEPPLCQATTLASSSDQKADSHSDDAEP